MLKLEALYQKSVLVFHPKSHSYCMTSDINLRISRDISTEKITNSVQEILVSRISHPNIKIKSELVSLQIDNSINKLPQIPLSLDRFLKEQQDPSLFKLTFSTQQSLQQAHQFILTVKVISNYKQIDNPCFFFKSCQHMLIGLIPQQSKKVSQQWLDSTGTYTKAIIYDWQVFFSGQFQGQYQVQYQGNDMRAYKYIVNKQTDPESIGFVVGRFKYQKIGITLKQSGRLLQIILMSQENVSQPQLVAIFSNYIYQLISFLNNIKLLRKDVFPIFILDSDNPPLQNITVLPTHIAHKLPPPRFPPVLKWLLRGLLVPFFGDNWIIQSIASYIDITTKQNMWKRKFNKIWQKLLAEIQSGRQDVNLGISQVRGIVIIHMLSQMTNQITRSGLAQGLINFSIKEGIRITQHNLFKVIKNTFGIKSIKHFSQQFVRSSAATKVSSKFWYSKKQNKINIQLLQKPIMHRHLLGRNKVHFILLQHFGINSKIADKLKTRNLNLSRQGPILVPQSLHAIPFLRGHVKLLIAQTNQQQYKQDVYQTNIQRKYNSLGAINYRSKLKKNIQKKQKPGQDHPKFQSAQSQMPNRLPGWLKVDPERCFLFSMDYDQPDRSTNAQYIMRSQLNNQKNQLQYFRVLRKVMNFRTPSILSTLLNKLDLRQTNQFSKQIRMQILQSLPQFSKGKQPKVYKFIMDMANTIFCHKDSVLPNFFVVSDMYQLKMAVLYAMSQLKIQDRPKKLFPLAQGMHFSSVQPTRVKQDQIVYFLLKIFSDNNNSYNRKNDAQYKAQIIKVILNFPTSKYCLQVMQQLQKQLYLQIRDPSFNLLVAKQLAKGINKYIDQSMLLPEQKTKYIKIFNSTLKQFALKLLKHNIYQLWQILFQSKIKVKQKYMTHKQFVLFFMEKFTKYKIQDQRLYLSSLQSVANILQSYSSMYGQSHNNSKESKSEKQEPINIHNQKYSLRMQTQLPLEESYMIAQMLWDRLVNSYFEFRNQWVRIYKAIYFYFTPIVSIAYHKKYPQLIKRKLPENVDYCQFFQAIFKDFNPDVQWLGPLNHLDKPGISQSLQEKDNRNSSRKKVKSQRQQVPLSGDGSLLIAFVHKHPERVNWIQLSKTIIDRTLHQHPQVQQLTVKIPHIQGTKSRAPLTLRGIRKKLKKGCIPKGYDLRHVQNDIATVLQDQPILQKVQQMFGQAKKAITHLQKMSRDNSTKIVLPLK